MTHASPPLRTERFYEQLLVHSFDCLVILDKNGVLTYTNDAVTPVLGFAPEELTGVPVIENMLHPDDIATVLNTFNRVLDGEEGFIQYRHRHKNNTWVWLESRANNQLNNPDIQGILITTRNITDRKRTEELLKRQEYYLATILENQPGLVWLKDKESRFLSVNRAYAMSCGFDNPEMLAGKNDYDVWPRKIAEKYHADDATVISSGCPKIVEEPIIDHGEQRWFETFKAPIRDSSGTIIGTTGYARDITARKKAEVERIELNRQLNQMQKLESLGILAGGIAHDFNNMLGGIFGYIDLAIQSSAEKSTNYLSKALATIDRARDLTKQLLTFAKGGEPIKKLERMAPFIEDSVTFALSGSNVSARYALPPDLWPCEIDSNQIGQVINNIVINATQAMAEGGFVEILAENVTFNGKQHVALKDGTYVKIEIKDHGIGIPNEAMDKVFDPFFTTKQKGHGLGLTTSYSIINRHGGTIEINSRPEKGSTFAFFIPATPNISAENPIDNSRRRHKGTGTFLIMDDEEVIRMAVGSMIETMGYSVRFALDGEEAVNIFEYEFRMGRKISGAIFDLTVPGGLSGKDAIAQIRKFDTNTPVYVASGYADDPVMANPGEYGFNGSICKPFRISELAELLNRY